MINKPTSWMVFAVAVIVCLFSMPAFADDSDTTQSANKASPDVYKVLLSNEHVNVLEMRLEPGKTDQWHRHPPETVYFVKGGKLKIHLPDGNAITKEVPDGGVMWHEAWVHRVENIGEAAVIAVIVEDISREK